MKVCIHASFKYGQLAEFAEFRGVCLKIEGTGNQDIKIGIGCFSCCLYEVASLNGPKLRPNKNSRSSLVFTLQIGSLSTNKITRPGSQGGEIDFVFLMGLLNPGCAQVFQR